MKRLCSICARGGSKGLPGKNIKTLGGRPLIAHSVAVARATGLFAHIAVSSDDPAIIDAAMAAGADIDVRRPDALATDTAGKSAAIHHCALEAERRTGIAFALFCDLDATAPLRSPAHVADAVALAEATGANVITAVPARRSPYFNMVERDRDGQVRLCKPLPEGLVRRQDAPPTYDMNASIYVWPRLVFMANTAAVLLPQTQLYVMPDWTRFDIDDEVDFRIVQSLYEVYGDDR